MNHEKDDFINIASIINFMGDSVSQVLPQLHAMTGCDTTAYKCRVSKIKTLQKVIGNTSLISLLTDVEEDEDLSPQVMENAKQFIQVCLYNGSREETYVVPPNRSSVENEIKRVHMQSRIRKTCTERIISHLDPRKYG